MTLHSNLKLRFPEKSLDLDIVVLFPYQTAKMDFQKICISEVWEGPKHAYDGAGKMFTNKSDGFELAFSKF